ncbi:MAG: energy-coupling factor transporter transmembrane component T family protein [Candidatus Thorarchaeota archaeon]
MGATNICVGIVPKKYTSRFYLDPRTKIILLFGVIVIILYTINLYILVSLTYISLILVILSGMEFKKLVRIFIFLTIFSVLAALFAFLTNITYNPYLTFTLIECRFLTSFLLITWFFRTTTPYELAIVLEKTYIPVKFTWFLTTIYQFIPTLTKETQKINEIRKVKGLTAKKWNIKQSFHVLRKSFNPLVTNSINTGIDLAETMIIKGFKPRRRETYTLDLKIKIIDLFVMILACTAVVLTIIYF